MRKLFVILLLISFSFFYSCLVRNSPRQALYDLQQQPGNSNDDDSVRTLSPYQQPDGDAARGYEYLTSGELFNSGIPYPFYKFIFKTANRDLLSLGGFNRYELNDFAVFEKDQEIATPGCLGCHAQWFSGEFIIGLGNSYSQFQLDYTKYLEPSRKLTRILYGKRSKESKNLENLLRAAKATGPLIVLEMQGPNPAHRISHIMASHRDPVTLQFRADTNYFAVPDAAVPTDIPALWLAKKKNAWNYDALAQGNAAKQFMISTILTLEDTAEAAIIYHKMKDVWAYLKTLQSPKFPYPIKEELASEGRLIFNSNCSGCHGTYGKEGKYPNLLIPENIIATDSLLLKYYRGNHGYEDWYNKSWYAAYEPAFTKPQFGYVAQPLDGIWVTAPYFHNGSVPTIEAVLNSKIRPRYWKRNFNKQEYNYENPGWKYRTLSRPGGKKTYNTDIPGYGNYGHYFGDHLSDAERKAIIEYLKTL